MSDSDIPRPIALFILIFFAIWLIFVVVELFKGFRLMFTFVHENFLAPKLEQWAEEYLASRRARRSQQLVHNPVPIQTQAPSLARQEVRQAQGLQVGNRPRASGVSQWRSEVGRRRTLSSSRPLGINLNNDTDHISQQVNVNPEPSPPSTILSFNSSANGTIILSRPASPTPQVSPMQSSFPSPVPQVMIVPVTSRVNVPLGNSVKRDDNPTTVGYLDDLAPRFPSTPQNSTPALSPHTPHSSQSILEVDSQLHLVTPGPPSSILFSTAHGAGEQVGSSPSGAGSSSFPPPAGIDIVWSSALSPGFPHFELPSVKFSSDADAPGDRRRENTLSSLGI